jgi:hypothetical protein
MANTPYRIVNVPSVDYSPSLAWTDFGVENGNAFELMKQEIDYSDVLKELPLEKILPDERFFDVELYPGHSTGIIRRAGIAYEKVLYLGNRQRIPLSTIGSVLCRIYESVPPEKQVIGVEEMMIPVELRPGEVFVALDEAGKTASYEVFNATGLIQDFRIERKLKQVNRR